MTWQFSYRATVSRVVDGDTIDVVLDRGFRDQSARRVRVAHIDTPETHGATRATGEAARAFTAAWLAARVGAWPLTLTILEHETDSFGRVLAEVRDATSGESLGDQLVASGNAAPYEGGAK